MFINCKETQIATIHHEEERINYIEKGLHVPLHGRTFAVFVLWIVLLVQILICILLTIMIIKTPVSIFYYKTIMSILLPRKPFIRIILAIISMIIIGFVLVCEISITSTIMIKLFQWKTGRIKNFSKPYIWFIGYFLS
jgi:hypothetical protein